MVSFAFLFCSTLLIGGAIAAPYPGDDAAAPKPNPEVEAKIHEQAEKSAKKVLEDVVAGKDVHESLLTRSINMVHKVIEEFHSMGHSMMKRWNEIKRGDSIGSVAGRWFHSVLRKVTGKNEKFAALVERFGVENIKNFVQSATNLIISVVMPSLNNGKELKADEAVVDKKSEAKLTELAKEFVNKPQ